jgi:hypothetical protein
MKAKKVFTFTDYDEDGDEIEVEMELPIKMELCNDCEGFGTVLNASMRHHAYTQEEFNEFSAEDREAYFTPGSHYHEQCPTCAGKNVVAVVHEPSLTKEQKAFFKKLQDREEAEARDNADDAFTRRMESGGYG